MTTYAQHPLSAAFPAMAEAEYQTLLDSVANIGVQNPVTLFEGMVIDGWHRYRAAMDAGVNCPTVELADGIDPRDFVKAQNHARRTLSSAQWAIAEAAIWQWVPRGNPSIVQTGTECPFAKPKTNAELAKSAGTSERTIKQAKKVLRDGVPEVVDAVKRGEIGLPKASKIAGLPKDQQADALAHPVVKQQPDHAEQADAGCRDEDPIAILSEEVDRLTDRLAVAAMDATEEERALAAQTIDDLRHQVRVLEAEIDAVKSSRDRLMNENAALKRQCESLVRKLKKLEQAA